MTHGAYNAIQSMGHGVYSAFSNYEFSMTHGAYGVVWHHMAHASWEFVMLHGPWVMEKKSLNGVQPCGCPCTFCGQCLFSKIT